MLSFSSLGQISAKIQTLLKAEVERCGVPVLHISAFGYRFDSAFWIAVKTDAQKDRLRRDEDLSQKLKSIFEDTGYLERIDAEWGAEFRRMGMANLLTPGTVFESQQTVDRDFGGNWFYAMK